MASLSKLLWKCAIHGQYNIDETRKIVFWVKAVIRSNEELCHLMQKYLS
jgi:hypothetical protein